MMTMLVAIRDGACDLTIDLAIDLAIEVAADLAVGAKA